MSEKKFVGLVILLNIAIGSASAESLNYDQVILRRHLNEIKSVIDPTQNPCDNFIKYTCGNFRSVSGGEYPNDNVSFFYFYNELLNLTDIKLPSTQKAKDLIESCQKYKSPKNILHKVNVLKDPSNLKIAKVLGVFRASGISAFLQTNITRLGNNRFQINMGVDEKSFISYMFAEKDIRRHLALLEGVEVDTAKDVIAFIRKGQSILAAALETSSDGNDPHAVKNFDWDEYLLELKELSNLSNATLEFVIKDIARLQRIIDLVSATDVEVLRALLAIKLMREAWGEECISLVEVFRLPIFAEFHRLHFTEYDKSLSLSCLIEFEELLKEIGVPSYETHLKRKIIARLDYLFDAERVENEFSDMTVEKDNFFQNFLMVRKTQVNEDLPLFRRSESIILEYYLEILNPIYRMKPVSYYFATQYMDLWKRYIFGNPISYEHEDMRDCLALQENEYNLMKMGRREYIDFVDEIQAAQFAYLNYKRFWEAYNTDHKMGAVLQEFNWTSDQVFFLNLAQRQCRRLYGGGNIEFRALLNMNEVGEAFNCPSGSQLNMPSKCVISILQRFKGY